MNDAEKLLQAAGGKVTILPGTETPTDCQWHVCSIKPRPGVTNHSGHCALCQCAIYFSDLQPTLKKVCAPCVIKFSKSPGDIELVSSVQSITKAILSQHRN